MSGQAGLHDQHPHRSCCLNRDQEAGPPWRALPVLLVGALLPVLDAFIVNVALATIGHRMHAGSAELELVVSGYGVAYACSLVAGGRLGDRFGRRRLFMIGMAAFTLCSVACGLAPTAAVLVVFRIAQGMAASLMFPQVIAAIQAGFTGADRQRALGYFGATIGIAGVLGQVLGGALLSADIAGLSWRVVFLVNVPVGIVTLAVCRRTVPESRLQKAIPVDVRGASSLAVVIALVLLPLTLGRSTGWPLWTWLSFAAAVPAGIGFVASQRRAERAGRVPLLPPSLLAIPAARIGLAMTVLFTVCLGGFLFSLSVILQFGHGFSPIASGLTMGPCALAFFGVSLTIRRLQARFGARLLVGGALLFALGLIGFAAVAASTGDVLTGPEAAAPLVIAGLGWAAVLVPLMGVVLGGLPAERAGLAGGVLSTAVQIGLAVGASVLGTVVFSVAGGHPDASSWRAVVLVVVGIECVLALATAACARRLAR